MIKDDEMLQFIQGVFEENYELLRLEGGHSLSPHVKQLALQQVQFYWKKLKSLAENVSETEVKLTLPLQKTPKGRKYTIQGIVDVVREDNQTVLYDIKTHDVEFVRSHKENYEGQLNIYAHIWQTIHGQSLDGTSIIATGRTEELRSAIHSGDQKRLNEALERWEPEVPIHFDEKKVEQTLRAFGEVVDMIEDGEFAPPSIDKLRSKIRDNKLFVDYVCRNCDIRFSCETFREYSFTSSRRKGDLLWYYEDYGAEHERIEFLNANLEEDEV